MVIVGTSNSPHHRFPLWIRIISHSLIWPRKQELSRNRRVRERGRGRERESRLRCIGPCYPYRWRSTSPHHNLSSSSYLPLHLISSIPLTTLNSQQPPEARELTRELAVAVKPGRSQQQRTTLSATIYPLKPATLSLLPLRTLSLNHVRKCKGSHSVGVPSIV